MKISTSTRLTLLIAAAGMLGMALFLETAFARAHGVSLGALHEHLDLPMQVHGFALFSIVLSLWPAATEAWSAGLRARPYWNLATIMTVGVVVLQGWTMPAAVVAFVFALASLVKRRIDAARAIGRMRHRATRR